MGVSSFIQLDQAWLYTSSETEFLQTAFLLSLLFPMWFLSTSSHYFSITDTYPPPNPLLQAQQIRIAASHRAVQVRSVYGHHEQGWDRADPRLPTCSRGCRLLSTGCRTHASSGHLASRVCSQSALPAWVALCTAPRPSRTPTKPGCPPSPRRAPHARGAACAACSRSRTVLPPPPPQIVHAVFSAL